MDVFPQNPVVKKELLTDPSTSFVCSTVGGSPPGHVSFTFWRAGAKSDELS